MIRPAALGRQGEHGAKGRAADEAAARRKLRACPLANAKAACFVKRPRDPGGLRARGGPFRNRRPSGPRNRTGGTPDFGPGPVRRKARLQAGAPSPEKTGASASHSPGRTGASAPGAAKPGRDPGLRSMDLSGGTGASALDPAGRGTNGFGSRNRQSGKRDFGSKAAERRTAGASAPTGSPRGKPNRASAPSDSGGCGARASALVSAPRNRPARMPRLPGRV